MSQDSSLYSYSDPALGLPVILTPLTKGGADINPANSVVPIAKP